MEIEQVHCTRCRDLHDEVDEYGDFRDLCDWCQAKADAIAADLAEMATSRDEAMEEDKWDEQRDIRRMR